MSAAILRSSRYDVVMSWCLLSVDLYTPMSAIGGWRDSSRHEMAGFIESTDCFRPPRDQAENSPLGQGPTCSPHGSSYRVHVLGCRTDKMVATLCMVLCNWLHHTIPRVQCSHN